jgi:hypothetical protein
MQDDRFDDDRSRALRREVRRRLLGGAIAASAALFALGAKGAAPASLRLDTRCQATGEHSRYAKPAATVRAKSSQIAAPGFDIADQRLSAFLAWVAHQTRRKLIYDDPEAQAIAHRVRLRGSIAGLTPEVALAAVLSTTSLRVHSSDDNSLCIGIDPPIDSTTATRPIRR